MHKTDLGSGLAPTLLDERTKGAISPQEKIKVMEDTGTAFQ